jgi:hypothetical protein
MREIYLLNYSVKGIKAIDKQVSLSFYKKTITKKFDAQEYNIKGIYGINGSGKSGIVTSVEILRNIIIDTGYLNNPIVQRNLDSLINKNMGEISIEVDYLINEDYYFRYTVTLTKEEMGKYVISHEQLLTKKATSKSVNMKTVFEVIDGEIVALQKDDNDKFTTDIYQKTMNLLKTASLSALFYEKNLKKNVGVENGILWAQITMLWFLGEKIHVYSEQSDNHREYVALNTIETYRDNEDNTKERNLLAHNCFKINYDYIDVIKATNNIVLKEQYRKFENLIDRLFKFIHVFKADLQEIEIEKKENYNVYVCDLVMVYDSYRIHAEYESTGIKKLIRLFAYINDMVHGGIIFIDEMDSNLHDVYLCALLEYLMENGEGQLCFTTHNVGPMDILNQRKKSIDFLSEDHTIYPWTKSGNYSPASLYRNGMIEGSPFNVDSIDFIGVFDSYEGD